MYLSAQDLMAVLGSDADSDRAWSGAMMLANALDDIAILRSFCEGMAQVPARKRKQ